MNKNHIMVATGGGSVYYGVAFPERTRVLNVSCVIFAALEAILEVRALGFRRSGVII